MKTSTRPFRHLLSLALFSFLGALPVQALHFYVDGNPAKGDDRRSVQSAQNPATPFRTITHALRIAHLVGQGRPHVIQIASGTYAPSTGEIFPLVVSQPGIYLQPAGTIILDAEGRSNFFRLDAAIGQYVLKGFIFINGRAEQGGAIYCDACSLRVASNRFFDNQAAAGGQVLYARRGRIEFVNNVLRGNGGAASAAPVIELHDTSADTSYRAVVRNNTFYRNYAPSIFASGSRTEIDSNIFLDVGEPTLVDASSAADPLVRYNMFWGTRFLLVTDRADSVKLARTVRDTVTLEEQGVVIPDFVTGPPDTLATVGEPYEFDIPVEGSKSWYRFRLFDGPDGVDSLLVKQQGLIRWTPTPADTGRHWLNVEIIYQVSSSTSITRSMQYLIHVFAPGDLPAHPGPIVFVDFVPDTVGALNTLNSLVPTFSSAASAGHNRYLEPVFLDSAHNRFELPPGSPALDAGNPIMARRDPPGPGSSESDTRRNNIGDTGGPLPPGPPLPDTSFAEIEITTLPDSVAVEGTVYTYDPVLKVDERIYIVDLIPGFGAPTMDPRQNFGRRPPITWTPTLADTGTYLIGAILYTETRQGRHYFPLHVRSLNQPPVVTSLPDTVAWEDAAYTYQLQATDANGDTLAFALVSGPQGLRVDARTGLVQWTPGQQDLGTVQVEIRVDDGKGASTRQRFSLTVRNTNDPPSITSVPDTVAVEDSRYTYLLQAADPDPGDRLTYALETAPAGARLDSAGLLTWTPAQRDVGVHPLAVRVRDASGASAVQPFSLWVVEVDDPPAIASQPDTLAWEDQLYQYRVQGVDEEGGRLTYALETAPAGARLDSAGLLTWTPAQQDIGVHALAVRVADPANQTAVQPFTVRVQPVNDPPLFTRVDPPADSLRVVAPGQRLLFRVEAIDEEGDPLGFSWLVNGALRGTGSSLEHLPSPTSLDTLTARVDDGIATASVTWIVDGRRLPRLLVAIDPVDFGVVAIGDTGRVTLTIANAGNVPLAIRDLQVGDLRFAAALSAASVPTGGAISLELRFAPADSQVVASAVTFATDDPEWPTVRIPMTGSGGRPGDFDDNEKVDFEDFFLFADQFNTTPASPNWDPRFSLDGDEDVDFEDFFLFADYFTRTAGPQVLQEVDFVGVTAAKASPLAAAHLDLRAAPSGADQVEVTLFWQGARPLRGYAMTLEFDPEALAFQEFAPSGEPVPLRWSAEEQPGRLTVAAGLAATQPDFGDDGLGRLRFARLAPTGTALVPTGVLVRFDGQTMPLAPPPSLSLEALPGACTLFPPYPNPFNPETTLSLYLPQEGPARLQVYDLLGRPVRLLTDGSLAQGFHTFSWQGRDQQGRPVAAGLYLVELRAGNARQVRKLLLLR